MGKAREGTTVMIAPLSMEEIARRSAELQLEIAETQLETQQLALEQQRETNQSYKAAKQNRERQNKQRQAQLAQDRVNDEKLISSCLHKQGGTPANTLEGDGKSALHRSRMLDGKTWLIQCGRCPLKVHTPHASLKKENPEEYARQMELYLDLEKQSKGSGLDPILGCTFSFETNGVPFLPDSHLEQVGL